MPKIIEKKIKCKHCGDVIISEKEHCVSCSCGKCKICDGVIKEAFKGTDYEDVSSMLLNG